MDVEDWKGDQRPVLTRASSTAISFHGYSPCDYIVEIGAIIVHPSSNRVLILEERDGLHRLPTCRVRQDMAAAFQNPLDSLQEETGYTLERLALRKFAKRMLGLESDSADYFDSEAVLLGETSTDTFHLTLDLRWIPDDEPPWQHPKEVVTLWFAGCITDENPPEWAPRRSEDGGRTGRLVELDMAVELLAVEEELNFSQRQAFGIFSALWKNRSSHNGVLNVRRQP